MAERIFIIDQTHPWEWSLDLRTKEYCAPYGLNSEWVPTGRSFGGSVSFLPDTVASALKPEDLCVFGFTPKVSEKNKNEFREAFIRAVREVRSNGNR